MIDAEPELTTGLSEEQEASLDRIAMQLENGVLLFQQVIASDGTKCNRVIIEYTGVDWPVSDVCDYKK